MIGEGELVFSTPESAFETVRQLLTDGNYVVMLSREEQFWMNLSVFTYYSSAFLFILSVS